MCASRFCLCSPRLLDQQKSRDLVWAALIIIVFEEEQVFLKKQEAMLAFLLRGRSR